MARLARVLPLLTVARSTWFEGNTELIVEESQYPDSDDDTGLVTATLSGTVTVQPSEVDENGDEVELSWEEATGGEFPFGDIFVGAFVSNPAGEPMHVAQTVVPDPTIDPNPFSFDVTSSVGTSVRVYAVLDEIGDRVLGTEDPSGTWPQSVRIYANTDVDDIDIVVHVEFGDGDDHDHRDTITITGDIHLQQQWQTGDVAAMILNTDGSGPDNVAWATPQMAEGNASAAYELEVCQDLGNMDLIGVWDKNDNGLADPSDLWGAYITAPDTDGNPIGIGGSDLTDYDIQIPLGEGGGGISVVPFVDLSGTVSLAGGSLADLPAGTDIVWPP